MLPDVGSMPPGNETPMCKNPFDDGTVLNERGHRGNGGRSQIGEEIAGLSPAMEAVKKYQLAIKFLKNSSSLKTFLNKQ